MADLIEYLRGQVFDDDLYLLADRLRVLGHEPRQQLARLLPVVAGVFLHLLEQRPIGAIGDEVLEHIEDEAFLNSLPHAVQAEWRERWAATRIRHAEQLQRF